MQNGLAWNGGWNSLELKIKFWLVANEIKANMSEFEQILFV